MTENHDFRISEEQGGEILAALAGGYLPGERVTRTMEFPHYEYVWQVQAVYRSTGADNGFRFTLYGKPKPASPKVFRDYIYRCYSVKLEHWIPSNLDPGEYECTSTTWRVQGADDVFMQVERLTALQRALVRWPGNILVRHDEGIDLSGADYPVPPSWRGQ